MGVVHEDEGVTIHDVVCAEVASYHDAVLREVAAALVHIIVGRWQNHQGLVVCQFQSLHQTGEVLGLGSVHLEAFDHKNGLFLGLVAQRTATGQLLHLVVELLGIVAWFWTKYGTTATEQWVLDGTSTCCTCSLLLLQLAG